MDVVRPWLVALVLSIGLQATYGYFLVDVVAVSELRGTSGRVVYLALPLLLINVVAAAAAALTHRAPERDRPVRHAVATLGLPVVLWVISMVQMAASASAVMMAASTAAALFGAALGWLVVVLVRQLRRPVESPPLYY